jgi:hypothetical protein
MTARRPRVTGADGLPQSIQSGDTLDFGPTGGGYAAGAGGAVTQATSKATGVTLSKPCGQITMNSASLAASTSVAFILTNTLIAATDVVQVSIASGAASTLTYLLQVAATAAGSCTIVLRNMSAVALSEAVVINFAIIKAVNA